MKAYSVLSPLVTLLVISNGSLAVEMAAGENLAEKNGSQACHAADHKIVGPSYQEVATKYKNAKGAAAMLAQKVKNGGGVVWGEIPMPANSLKVSDADI